MVDRYKRSAQLTSGFNLDQTNVKEAIRSSETLNKRLDQIMNLTYKGMEKTAERQGLQYAVTNRPTLDQIATAVQNNDDPSKLYAQTGTVFGDAAREAQAEYTRQDFEYDLSKKYSEIGAALEAGMEVEDLNAFAADIQAEIDGYSDTLGKISPLKSQKFKASMTIKGSTVYAKALTNYVNRQNAVQQFKIENSINQFSTDFESLLRDSGYNYGETMTLLAPDLQRLNGQISRYPGKAEENLQTFKNIKSRAFQRGVVKYLLDPNTQAEMKTEGTNVVDMIRSGKLGKMQLAYDALENKDKEGLMEAYLKEAGNKHKFQTENTNRLKAEEQAKLFNLEKQWANGEITGEQIINEQSNMGIVLSSAEQDRYRGGPVETDQQAVFAAQLKGRILRGEEPDTVQAAYDNGLISAKGYTSLMGDYTNVVTRINTGLKQLKVGLGYEEYTSYHMMNAESQRLFDKMSTQLFDRAYQAFDKNEGFSVYENAKSLLEENKVNEMEEIVTKATADINTILKEIGATDIEINFDSIDDLKGLDTDKEIQEFLSGYNLNRLQLNKFRTKIKSLIKQQERQQ